MPGFIGDLDVDLERGLAECASKTIMMHIPEKFFRPLRQVIESVNQTLKGQLDLERHGGRTADGVTVRIRQRILALTAAIWHNGATGQPVMRSLATEPLESFL